MTVSVSRAHRGLGKIAASPSPRKELAPPEGDLAASPSYIRPVVLASDFWGGIKNTRKYMRCMLFMCIILQQPTKGDR